MLDIQLEKSGIRIFTRKSKLYINLSNNCSTSVIVNLENLNHISLIEGYRRNTWDDAPLELTVEYDGNHYKDKLVQLTVDRSEVDLIEDFIRKFNELVVNWIEEHNEKGEIRV